MCKVTINQLTPEALIALASLLTRTADEMVEHGRKAEGSLDADIENYALVTCECGKREVVNGGTKLLKIALDMRLL